jgi:hypothetical protein
MGTPPNSGLPLKDACFHSFSLDFSCRYPNIVSYRESFVEKGLLCILMDFADSGDLYARVQKQKGVLLKEEVRELFLLLHSDIFS